MSKKKISVTLDADVVIELTRDAGRQGTNVSAVLNRIAREYLSPEVKLANEIVQHKHQYSARYSAADVTVIAKALNQALIGIELKRTQPTKQRAKGGRSDKEA